MAKSFRKTKLAIGHSANSGRVYVGKQTEDGIWVGNPKEATQEFINVSLAFFSTNTVRGFNRVDGSKNLILNVKVDSDSLQLAIEQLQAEREKLLSNGNGK